MSGMSSHDQYEAEESYIIDESPEISVGESVYLAKIAEMFPALQNRNYRLYFAGQLVSMIGTWLQIVAEGWLVLTLTHSALIIGIVAALATVPSLLFSLFGGVIVDRLPKKNILIFTQTAAMIFAFILGILTVMKVITVWEIGLFAFLLGTVTAVDSPARQAFVPELVTRDQMPSAIALNAGVFNAARVIGPGVAGFLIAFVGTGGAYLLNGFSYIAVIIALFMLKLPAVAKRKNLHPIKAIQQGLSYSFGHPVIRTLFIFVGLVSVFGWSYSTVMPLIAQNTFHLDAAGLGYLYAANGLGSLIGTFMVSAYAKKMSPVAFIIGGNTLFTVCLTLFTFTSSFPLALFILFFAGVGLLLQFATMSTMIQSMVADEFRGRVMSIYTLMFLGLSPIGNFEIGWLSEKFGTSVAIRVGMAIVFIFGWLVYFSRKRIGEQYKLYKKQEGLA